MCVDVEKPFVYRMSEEPIKQEFLDGTIETENSFGSRWALHEILGAQVEYHWTPQLYTPQMSWCIIH